MSTYSLLFKSKQNLLQTNIYSCNSETISLRFIQDCYFSNEVDSLLLPIGFISKYLIILIGKS